MRAKRIEMDSTTLARGRALVAWAAALFMWWERCWLYQCPTPLSSRIPQKARTVNHMIEDWPCLTMMRAARRGPRDDPKLPPVWKTAWAKPLLFPAAMWATREASGWKMADPMPIRTEETRIMW